MEGLQKAVRSAMGQSPSPSPSPPDYKIPTGVSPSLNPSSSSDQSRLLLTRPPRQAVSLWTCSKLCAFCFVAGIIVGYTLKRRVRRWASRLLRRLKDD